LIKRLENIKKILENKKATNVDMVDLENKNYIVNSVIIATTLNSKHGDALLNYLKE
jgi:ribosome-associated protein